MTLGTFFLISDCVPYTNTVFNGKNETHENKIEDKSKKKIWSI